MLDSSDEDAVKVIIVGDGFAGKTSLLRRFVRGDFVDQYKKTIGAEFLEKDVFLRNSNATVKLMLWDTAGQEVFNALTQAYYRGAGAAVLVFSTTDRQSFENVEKWKQRVEEVCGPITLVLCQSKFDLSHEAAITNEEAEGLAKWLKIPFYRVSSKDDFNVTQLFEFTAQHCLSAAGDDDDDDDDDANDGRDGAKAPSVPLKEGSAKGGSNNRAAAPVEPAAATPNASRLQTAAGPSSGNNISDKNSTAGGGDGAVPAASPAAAPAVGVSAVYAASGSHITSPNATDTHHHHHHHHHHHKKEEANPHRVTLNEANIDATAGKRKKKIRCTLL